MKSSVGKFITFDGIDGAGKTTQINLLADYLSAAGKTVYTTREPGGTLLSEHIRELLLSTNHKMAATTELLLMFAARAEHIEAVLRPKVLAGDWVICSRFTDATMAYQGYARGVDLHKIEQIASVVHGDFNPDISIFLDLPAEEAAARRNQRGEVIDRFEAEDIAFMKAVRDGYLAIARQEPRRCKVIDARQSADDIQQAIRTEVMAHECR
ncbi:MAG: dTMP kinase [Gammaproteobacteria bacterium]|nr:MAG: dTMP kinase [Gammaproteobacteria bacterium]